VDVTALDGRAFGKFVVAGAEAAKEYVVSLER